jgi:hypothetical protein
MSTLRLTATILQHLWSLCSKDYECGGQLTYAVDQAGQCVLKATRVVSKTGRKSSVFFDQSLIAQNTMDCNGSTANVLYHTHPLSVVVPKDKLFGRYAPPSVSDFFAHGVLGNYRQWKENKHLNTYVVMATEGLYVYNISPAKFDEVIRDIATLFMEKQRSVLDVSNFNKGQLPTDVVNAMKREHYRNVTDGYLQYVRDMNRICADDLYRLQTEEFFDTMQYDGDFIQHNAYQDALNTHGFQYQFYPAPFLDDILLLAEHASEQA